MLLVYIIFIFIFLFSIIYLYNSKTEKFSIDSPNCKKILNSPNIYDPKCTGNV